MAAESLARRKLCTHDNHRASHHINRTAAPDKEEGSWSGHGLVLGGHDESGLARVSPAYPIHPAQDVPV